MALQGVRENEEEAGEQKNVQTLLTESEDLNELNE